METRSGLLLNRKAGVEVLTLIDDQHLSGFPPAERGSALSYAFDLLIEIALTWRDRSPGMDGHTCRT